MNTTISIEFTGGFHNYASATVRAKIEDKGTYLGAYLSVGQVRKLAREFCGVSDCMCGGVYRAEMELPPGWTAVSSATQAGLIAHYGKAPQQGQWCGVML